MSDASLRDRIEELEEENRQLRDLLKCEDVELPREWGLTKAEARFVRLILGNPIATYELIMSALWWDKADGPPDTAHNSISIRVCRIRQKIPLLRDGLKNVHGQGYELTDAARREIGVLRERATLPDKLRVLDMERHPQCRSPAPQSFKGFTRP